MIESFALFKQGQGCIDKLFGFAKVVFEVLQLSDVVIIDSQESRGAFLFIIIYIIRYWLLRKSNA